MLNKVIQKILRIVDSLNDKDSQNIERELQRRALIKL